MSTKGSIPAQAAHERVKEPLKVAEEMSAQQLMEKLGAAAERQAELVTHLKARYVGEGSSLAQKDEETSLFVVAQEDSETAPSL